MIAAVLDERGPQVLRAWMTRAAALTADGAAELERDGAAVLDALQTALAGADRTPDLAPVSGLLSDFGARRTRAGDLPAQTAGLVLALREALLGELAGSAVDADRFAVAREAGRIVDDLALGSFDSFLAGREEVISAQGEQLLELSTPVVRVWDRVVAAPLIGTLDSARAQVVMESLLQAIGDDGEIGRAHV